jgi:hypothetical protein
MPELTYEQALQVRFGDSSAHSQASICLRCGLPWTEHSDARCPSESLEHYQQFLRGTHEPINFNYQKEAWKLIKLGADPEFEVSNSSGARLDASTIHGLAYSGELGRDGAAVVGEIRPPPGDPSEVVNNISRILDEANRVLRGYDMYAGSGKRYPIGGHIHFSGIKVNTTLLRQLDNLITVPLNSISSNRIRSGSGYGQMSEYRSQPHGWEYRAPCSWISHPDIARGVMEISHKCAMASMEVPAKLINTKEDLLAYAGTKEGNSQKVIAKFYAIIEKFTQNNVKLEEVEIFQAWKKRTLVNQVASTEVKYEFNGDNGLPEVKSALEKVKVYKLQKMARAAETMTLRIVGASREREPYEKVVYLPEMLREKIKSHKIMRIKIRSWSQTTVGLSSALREDLTSSVEILRYIRWYIGFITRSTSVDKITRILQEIEG